MTDFRPVQQPVALEFPNNALPPKREGRDFPSERLDGNQLPGSIERLALGGPPVGIQKLPFQDVGLVRGDSCLFLGLTGHCLAFRL